MEANIYDVKSWTKSYFGSGTRVSQLVHIIRRHWEKSMEYLENRQRRKRTDVATFCGISAEALSSLLREILEDRGNQEEILAWINDPDDWYPLIFIHAAPVLVGKCLRKNGQVEACSRVLLWLEKGEGLMPHICSFYPVPDNYGKRFMRK